MAVTSFAAPCNFSTQGFDTVEQAMAHPYVSHYGSPTGNSAASPSIPVIKDLGMSQIWAWYPVNGKTLVVMAVHWHADFSTDWKWKISGTAYK